MNLIQITTRHKELEVNIQQALESFQGKGDFNPMSLMKVFSGGGLNLEALGLPESLFSDLAEYQTLSARLRDVAEKVAAKMEAATNA
ncbi:hypothetical protein OPW13_12530 [Vibrio europaeus]|uniref:Uncharacterized protein n=1 Tax=Vibrio europaeus TaxID=300876 RepID=A0A178JB77_9VIBR|nr:hypothetical protein [Vibrio europaeus]MDC5704684.1 hypothetical protein [Vibrio europaeus]MDC5711598.1 hypothetical protein [Vibrio europaeus]MDC5713513.1 hypothetical protein [Vibrio europaeus]MDC5843412.1 hypothetical protein [Vibrio europaeus]MDC5860025.1 hypothetical protein [Vibrio europaeus]